METRPTSGVSETHQGEVAATRREAHDSAPAARPDRTEDSVNLTDGARQLHELQGAVAGTPAVDAARVAELRGAIANGSYRIDPQRIADGLLAQDRASLG